MIRDWGFGVRGSGFGVRGSEMILLAAAPQPPALPGDRLLLIRTDFIDPPANNLLHLRHSSLALSGVDAVEDELGGDP